MLFFLISCLSFLFLFETLSLQFLHFHVRTSKVMKPFLVLLWQGLLRLCCQWLRNTGAFDFKFLSKITMKMKISSRPESVEKPAERVSLLDLPELVLETILGRLPPAGLCNMAIVCSSMRDRCWSDHLWERHLNEKWSRVLGQAAFNEWQHYVAARKKPVASDEGKSKGLMGSFSCILPLSWLKSKIDGGSGKPMTSLPVDSTMSWYLSLESGKFWFPAQVYNREHGHVGFMLSCYDAELSYDCQTDTFQARYPPHGRRTIVIEEGIPWERLRAAPVDTPARDLHVSDCLNDLRPGDHIEIQWRRNKEFPYGWWYGVVGHLDSCGSTDRNCCCHLNDTVILEFNQYAPGSRWRRTAISRKDHREEGNEAGGFYGGIRKLSSKDEISTWRHLWPHDILE
ncbi:F-box protein [Nymphaea thermarum]|nr:F-box protein [Nymphaea thermarum]